MILKDEQHIIESTLEHLKKYICYWVISDTGSTDNTREIVKDFFARNNIPGHLFEHKWEDFGTNRTLAIQACYPFRKHFDYIWVFDGDDKISGTGIPFPLIDKNHRVNPDMFSLKFGDGFTYMRNQVFKAQEEWKYVSVLHEFPAFAKKTRQPTVKTIEGDYYIDSRRLGARSKAADKYAKDAAVLEKGLVKEPKNERYMFYLGQSYFDAGNYEKSIYWYQKRVDQGKWFEEVYYSLYKIAEAKLKLGKDWTEVEKAYITAWKNLPSRAEPLYEIAKHYREVGNYEKGYLFAKQASKIPFPKEQVLFLFKEVYDYKAMNEMMICAFGLKNYQESFDLGNTLLRRILPDDVRKKIERDRDMNIEHIITSYEKYPVKKIIDLKKNCTDTKNIIFTITTCKRYDLFVRTVNSFLNCCEDVLRIDKWLCVDDNSSSEDREKMQKLYPFFEFVFKGEPEKGHVQSMNIIFSRVQNYKYNVHMEDDWTFFEKRNYVTEAISILESNEKYGQALFNVNYAQRSSCRRIAGGFVENVGDLRIVEHEYYPPGPEYDEFISENVGKSTQAYWPHYSLRPSVLKVSMLKDVGDFSNETGHFEMDYAKRYVSKGHISVFFDTICSYHTGKCTWEKGDNSYSLNGVTQFGEKRVEVVEIKEDGDKENEKVFDVETDGDWLVVKNMDSFGNDIKCLGDTDVEILKMVALSDDSCVGFNSLGYLKSTIYKSTQWIDVSSRFPDFKMYVHKTRYSEYLKGK